MNVNFEYYKIFYYVAKYRNFTKAAQALENSQPNITRAMNCLEQQIHTTLFGADEPWCSINAGRRKALYACICSYGAAYDRRGRAY